MKNDDLFKEPALTVSNSLSSNNYLFTSNQALSKAPSVPHLRQLFLPALLNLEYVQQSPRYHPEGDALYHSLQVFELAYRATSDAELWAAALLHDLGKAVDIPRHDEVGAQMLSGLLSDRVVWLVAHHLDLLKHPAKTRRRYRGSSQLHDLEKLRRWDLGGRKTDVDVITPEEALDIVLNGLFA